MKKKRIKTSKNRFILKIKKVLFDDTELFEEQDYNDIPDVTEEELNKMVEELKNS